MKNVLIIGSTNVDLVSRCKRFPNDGETIIAKSFNMNLGGKGANQAVAATITGANVKFLTCIGNDSNGKFAINELHKYKVDVCPIYKKIQTGNAQIIVNDKTGENRIIINGGANMKMSPEDIDKNIDLINWADYILLQFEIPIKTTKYIINLAHKLNKIIILNPAPFVKIDIDILKKINYITPNEGELQKLSNQNKSYIDNAKKLIDIGFDNIIVTLGKDGSCLINKENVINIDSYKVKVVDTTGAGDCYNGIFVGFMALGFNINDALNIASFASSMSVTKKGAAKSYLSKKELFDFVNKIKDAI